MDTNTAMWINRSIHLCVFFSPPVEKWWLFFLLAISITIFLPFLFFFLFFLCNVRLKTNTDYVVFVAFKNEKQKKRSSWEKTKNKNLFQSDLTFYAFYTTNKNNNNNTRKLFEPGHVSIVVYDKYIFLFISKHTFNVQCPMSIIICTCVSVCSLPISNRNIPSVV